MAADRGPLQNGPEGEPVICWILTVRKSQKNGCKRAGGTGLISGRKAFQRPMQEGIWLLHCIQDVYACEEVTVA